MLLGCGIELTPSFRRWINNDIKIDATNSIVVINIQGSNFFKNDI